MRNLILSAVLVSASLFGMTAQAADVPLEAGKTYVELANPVPVAEPGKIEVVELFWYSASRRFAASSPRAARARSAVHCWRR